MPKIIIINNCNDCPYAQHAGLGVICHKLKELGKYDVPYDMDDCPLEPMTEEKMVDAIPISFLKDRIAFNEAWGCHGYAKGLQSAINEWNDRLEEIEDNVVSIM